MDRVCGGIVEDVVRGAVVGGGGVDRAGVGELWGFEEGSMEGGELVMESAVGSGRG